MDLGRADDEAATTVDFRAVQAIDLGDWFVFAIERTSALDQLVDGAAVRYRIAATLAGRPFEQVTVDVGFGGPLPSVPEVVRGPDLLAFADIDPLAIPMLSLEQHVAEKLHAYTREYGAGRQNTRVKDLVDLALIQTVVTFEAGHLREALAVTFADRRLQPLPAALPPPQRLGANLPQAGPRGRAVARSRERVPNGGVVPRPAARRYGGRAGAMGCYRRLVALKIALTRVLSGKAQLPRSAILRP